MADEANAAAAPAAPKPMGSLLSYQAARDPDRPAFTFDAVTLTRAALDSRANRMARALAARGIGQDDVVALVLANGPANIVFAFALWKLGASPLPISNKLPQKELLAILELAQPRLVVGPRPGEAGGCECVPADYEPQSNISDAPLADKVAAHWKHMTSGGSTGRPKIIVDAAPSLASSEGPGAVLKIRKDDVLLHPAPMYHNAFFAQANWGLCAGAHVIGVSKFDAIGWLELVEKHRPRWCYLVPTMMNRIWNVPAETRAKYDLSSVEIFMHMAAPCPDWLKQAWIDWLGGERIWEIFASTEPVGASTINGVEWLAHRGSVGKPMGQMRILDEDGQEVQTGDVGEIYFKRPAGDFQTYRYIGAQSRLRDEWETLGDMGRVDADGYLYIADRRPDMIVSGGANIFPAEIEAALEAHPSIASSAVVGLPHADFGRVPHAIIELHQGAPAPSAAELDAFLTERLARYKLPYTFEIAGGVVRDDAGKLRRTALRDEREARVKAGEVFTPLRTRAKTP
jgi:bile acid-coenzyme A ligase